MLFVRLSKKRRQASCPDLVLIPQEQASCFDGLSIRLQIGEAIEIELPGCQHFAVEGIQDDAPGARGHEHEGHVSTQPSIGNQSRRTVVNACSMNVKIVTVGSRSFVTSFQLAGVPGVISETPQKAFDEIEKLTDDSEVGLVLVSDDISEPISDKLTDLRSKKSTLVFSLPSIGSKKTEVNYRIMLKKILGV